MARSCRGGSSSQAMPRYFETKLPSSRANSSRINARISGSVWLDNQPSQVGPTTGLPIRRSREYHADGKRRTPVRRVLAAPTNIVKSSCVTPAGFMICVKPSPSRPTAELKLRKAAIRLKANCAADGQCMLDLEGRSDLKGRSCLTGRPGLDGRPGSEEAAVFNPFSTLPPEGNREGKIRKKRVHRAYAIGQLPRGHLSSEIPIDAISL